MSLGLNPDYKIKDAFASYLATNSKKKTEQSQKTDKRVLYIAEHYLCKELGLELMSEVGLESFERFELWAAESQECGPIKKEPWSPASILRHGKTLKSIFRKAFLTGRIQRDPTALWKLSSVDPMKPRRPMRDDELETILGVAPDWFKPVLRMLAATGARPSSIARLKWSDVDFEKHTLYFTSRKGGAKREKRIPFPITDEIKTILSSIERDAHCIGGNFAATQAAFVNGFVFKKHQSPITGPDISTLGHRLIKDCGLNGVVLYGLRHKFATDLLRSGTSTELARRLMGHSNEMMLKQYTSQLGIESLEQAVTSMRSQNPKQSK